LGKTSGAPPLEALPLDAARAVLKETMLNVGCPRREVMKRRELTIEGQSSSFPIRVYQPVAAPAEKLPVIMLIHGGGWALGDLDCYENMARFFCDETRSVVVSVGYRLAPEYKFPLGLNDCYAALKWTHNHAADLGGDAARLTLMGDSSGGNLAAAVCLRAVRDKGPVIARQVLLYPLLSLEDDPSFESRKTFGGGDYFISQSSIAWTVKLYLSTPEDAALPLASPVQARNFEGLPHALIVSAGFDPLRDEAQAYAQKLRQASVRVDTRCFESAIHGFLSFSGALDVGTEGLHFVAEWLCNHA
jgi:acetyl esterase/lipase